jgi:hypothetical protein
MSLNVSLNVQEEKEKNEIDLLIDKIKEKVEENKVVVLRILKRTSDSYYNYKTELIVVFKPKRVRWEESDVRDVEVMYVSCGVFQKFPIALPEILVNELEPEYVVHHFDVF